MVKKIRTLKERITGALDVPGVHPGDDRWGTAFHVFFDALRVGATLREALGLALDTVGCHDLALRNQAFVVFDMADAEGEMVQGEIKPQEPVRPRLIKPLIQKIIRWLTEKN